MPVLLHRRNTMILLGLLLVLAPSCIDAFQAGFRLLPDKKGSKFPTETHCRDCKQLWYPDPVQYDDDIFGQDDATLELQDQLVEMAATMIRRRLRGKENSESIPSTEDRREEIQKIVSGRFMDLTGTQEGEDALESLFVDNAKYLWISAKEAAISANTNTKTTIRGVCWILQSLCIMGTQVGLVGRPDQLERMVAHLGDSNEVENTLFSSHWDHDCVRRLKHKLDREPALALLRALKWKLTTQGAFDLLAAIGAWNKHENLPLLRSGFPIRFTRSEEKAAEALVDDPTIKDPDALLGLRRDLRHLKVYTIDSDATTEIDDGLSVEPISVGDDRRLRIWIHIADAGRWAPRNSDVCEAARRRITSLYLPEGTIPMFPPLVATNVMSLRANQEVCALSLGVELNDDGSFDPHTIIVTPSTIRVTYRLNYEEVDDMLEEGIGYSEEWEIGVLLDAALKRRQYRLQKGSWEGTVPTPIPSSEIKLFEDSEAPDGVGISLEIQVSHNSARNKTATSEDEKAAVDSFTEEPLSSANLLVTEAMILAGEALGAWRLTVLDRKDSVVYPNDLRLPFRTQRPPDFKGRSRERRVMMNFLEYGNAYCYAWYARRFLEPVRVMEEPKPHAAMGLDSYVQWSSPIRRFSDLQVHTSVKRYLRRCRVYELVSKGCGIPDGIDANDLGLPSKAIGEERSLCADSFDASEIDSDIDYLEGIGLIGVSRNVQRRSQSYWMFEHLRRIKEEDPDTTFTAIVLGCINPEKQIYAIYVTELGLEHKFTSPGLTLGSQLRLTIGIVQPRGGLLQFVRVV